MISPSAMPSWTQLQCSSWSSRFPVLLGHMAPDYLTSIAFPQERRSECAYSTFSHMFQQRLMPECKSKACRVEKTQAPSVTWYDKPRHHRCGDSHCYSQTSLHPQRQNCACMHTNTQSVETCWHCKYIEKHLRQLEYTNESVAKCCSRTSRRVLVAFALFASRSPLTVQDCFAGVWKRSLCSSPADSHKLELIVVYSLTVLGFDVMTAQCPRKLFERNLRSTPCLWSLQCSVCFFLGACSLHKLQAG